MASRSDPEEDTCADRQNCCEQQNMNVDVNVSPRRQRARGQVQQLQDRIRVLERIVTDRGVETAAQIEALRERDRIAEEDKA